MKTVLTVLIFLLSASFAQADTNDVLESVCKIMPLKAEGKLKAIGGGTGWVFKESKTHYYVMTAGHVVKDRPTFWIRFYIDGKESDDIAAYIVATDYNEVFADPEIRDLAILRVPKKDLKIKPKIIPLAEGEIKGGDQLITAGCPEGRWPSAALGHIIVEMDVTILFRPAVYPGQSGSPICNRAGTKAIGIVVHYNNATKIATGISCNAVKLHDLVERVEL